MGEFAFLQSTISTMVAPGVFLSASAVGEDCLRRPALPDKQPAAPETFALQLRFRRRKTITMSFRNRVLDHIFHMGYNPAIVGGDFGEQ